MVRKRLWTESEKEEYHEAIMTVKEEREKRKRKRRETRLNKSREYSGKD